jgi:transposase-like protein
METSFSFQEFINRFPDDTSCLEEIKKFRYPKGIHCLICDKVTKHYKLAKRNAYSCQFCRTQVYPLTGTIFEKTTTPLRMWFYTMYILLQTRGNISIISLQNELGVTYKTAWRMYKRIYLLMKQHNGDLLDDTYAESDTKVHKWVFFNTFEFKVVQKKDTES